MTAESNALLNGIFLGAAGLAIITGLFVAIRKTWSVATSMETALQAVPRLIKVLEELVTIASGFRQELAYLRGVATGSVILQQPGDIEPNAGGTPQEPRAPTPFPSPVFDRFTVKPDAPDATKEESVIFAQTDEEMAEIEKLDNLRNLGYVVEDVETPHEARQVDSE